MSVAASIQITKSVLALKHLGGKHDEKSHGNRGSGKSKLWDSATLAGKRERQLKDVYEGLVRSAKQAGISTDDPRITEARISWHNAKAQRMQIELAARKEDRAAGLTHQRRK